MNFQVMVKHIEMWLIDKLLPYAKNPTTHSAMQIARIAASIAEFGFNNPILVDTKAGIIAGHGRLLGARKLHLTEVPVTLLRWQKEPEFQIGYLAAKRAAFGQSISRLHHLTSSAVSTLGKIMLDANTPAATRA